MNVFDYSIIFQSSIPRFDFLASGQNIHNDIIYTWLWCPVWKATRQKEVNDAFSTSKNFRQDRTTSFKIVFETQPVLQGPSCWTCNKLYPSSPLTTSLELAGCHGIIWCIRRPPIAFRTKQEFQIGTTYFQSGSLSLAEDNFCQMSHLEPASYVVFTSPRLEGALQYSDLDQHTSQIT